jgi:predicted ATP-binding protein involved in virulence
MSNEIDKLEPYLKDLLDKAEKGDLKAAFKIVCDLDDGKLSVTDSESFSILFENIFLSNLKKHKIKIFNLRLLDFRLFNNLNLNFSKRNVTIIFGVNGVGKTTVLDSIAKTLTWISFNIRNENTKGRLIDISDININAEFDYASVISEIRLGKSNKFKVELTKSKEGVSKKKSSFLEDVKLVASMYRKAVDMSVDIELPFFAYYPVERSYTSRNDLFKKNIVNKSDVQTDRFDAYVDSFDGSTNFESFFSWYKKIDDLINQNENQDVAQHLKLIKEQLKNNEKGMPDWLQKNEMVLSNKTIHLKGILDVVKLAIKKFIPYFEDIIIDREELGQMFILKKENDGAISKISIFQLSQGERSLMALIADISRRLLTLNPTLERPLESAGIVLIDEVDLHLHPEWQQKIVSNLESTFPNIQFLLTTHSPQTLSSVHSDCIRKLSNGKVYDIAVQTYGEDANVILEDVMSVSSKVKNKDNELLEAYLIKVNDGDISSHETIAMRVKLNYIFGESNSKLLIADMLINKWKSLM